MRISRLLEIEYNAEFDGKRTVKTVVGGKHIVDTTYKIKGVV